jgi:hypothetical protein
MITLLCLIQQKEERDLYLSWNEWEAQYLRKGLQRQAR